MCVCVDLVITLEIDGRIIVSNSKNVFPLFYWELLK